jgi:hypothetical protein
MQISLESSTYPGLHIEQDTALLHYKQFSSSQARHYPDFTKKPTLQLVQLLELLMQSLQFWLQISQTPASSRKAPE